MSLRHALLGLLTKHSATGYELSREFKQTMTHFWTAHHTQIYRELVKMEEASLVSSQIVHQTELPDKKVYTIEQKGYEVLLDWLLHQSVGTPNLKDEFLLRVSLFQLISVEHAIAFLRKSKQNYHDELTQLKTGEEMNFDTRLSDIGEYLTAEYGRRYMKTWIDWCDWAIAWLEQYELRNKGDEEHEDTI